MQGIDSTSFKAFASAGATYEIRPERHSKADDAHRSEDKGHRSEEKGEVTRSRKGAGRAANIFRQEFMMKIKQSFSVEIGSRSGTAGAYQRSDSVRDVAAGVLTAVRSITEKNIDKAPETIAAIRESVGQAASASQRFTENGDEAAAVKETAALVNSGLDELEEKVALGSVRELTLESKVKERTSIRIRTQEGDVVTFKLRRIDKLSLSDELAVSDSNSSRTTELSISSSSRLSIVVKGDLNEAEQEAIRTVFAAAERLADEFFSGDLDAALEIAAGLEFDSEQLARVSMRFRSEEKISVSQSVQQLGQAHHPHDEIEGPKHEADVPRVSVPRNVTGAPVTVTEPVVAVADPVVPGTIEPVVAVADPVAPEIVATVSDASDPEVVQGSAPTESGFLAGFDSLFNFLGKLAEYLGQAAGAIENRSSDHAHRSEVRFEIDQSFKLEILRAVMSVSAPDERESGADLSASRIQQLDVIAEVGPRRLVS